MTGVELRPLGLADLEAAVELERTCYRAPWSPSMLRGELLRSDGVQLGAFRAARLVGALFAASFGGPWHVMNVAVHPSERRAGIARRMLDELFALTCGRDEEGYTLEVRVSNQPAIALYASYGFASAGTRPRYYVDNGEDAMIMWRASQGHEPMARRATTASGSGRRGQGSAGAP